MTQTVNVSGNGTYSTTHDVRREGRGHLAVQVDYTGDTNNRPASSACGVEQFTIANH